MPARSGLIAVVPAMLLTLNCCGQGGTRRNVARGIFVLDTATANAVMFAIAAHADEREAHIREVERYGQTLPEDSY